MLLDKLIYLFKRVLYEVHISGAAGLVWAVGDRLAYFLALADNVLRLIVEMAVGKSLPNILYCCGGWVNHVFGIESVVAQFIHHNFIGGKVKALTI